MIQQLIYLGFLTNPDGSISGAPGLVGLAICLIAWGLWYFNKDNIDG